MFDKKRLMTALYSRPFYAGEGDEGGEGGGEGGGESNTPKPGTKVYNENEFNAHMSGLRKKYETQITKLQDEVKKGGMSAGTKKALESQIEEMQAELRTKEEQAEHEKTQLETKFTQQIEDLGNQSKFWETNFTKTVMERDLLTAATHPDHESYNPDQLVELLRGKTKVVRNKAEDGTELDTFSTKVVISLPDSKTKEMTELLLSPKDAVKRMSEATQLYGNLFKSNLKGGFDGSPNRGEGKNGEVDMDELARSNPAEYMRLRKLQRQGKTDGK